MTTMEVPYEVMYKIQRAQERAEQENQDNHKPTHASELEGIRHYYVNLYKAGQEYIKTIDDTDKQFVREYAAFRKMNRMHEFAIVEIDHKLYLLPKYFSLLAEMRALVQLQASFDKRRSKDATTSVGTYTGPPAAYLFECWKPGRRMSFASVDPDDNLWLSSEQWYGVRRTPLSTCGEATVIFGSMPERKLAAEESDE